MGRNGVPQRSAEDQGQAGAKRKRTKKKDVANREHQRAPAVVLFTAEPQREERGGDCNAEKKKLVPRLRLEVTRSPWAHGLGSFAKGADRAGHVAIRAMFAIGFLNDVADSYAHTLYKLCRWPPCQVRSPLWSRKREHGPIRNPSKLRRLSESRLGFLPTLQVRSAKLRCIQVSCLFSLPNANCLHQIIQLPYSARSPLLSTLSCTATRIDCIPSGRCTASRG